MFPSLLTLIRFLFNRCVDKRRPGSLGFSIFKDLNARCPTLMLANNKGADQPAHPRSLISAFVIRYLKSKVTRSDISLFSILFGGLQHDESSGYAPVQIYVCNVCHLNTLIIITIIIMPILICFHLIQVWCLIVSIPDLCLLSHF